jgi:heme A synthase
MKPTTKTLLLIGGFLAAALLVGQVVLGQLILSGSVNLIKAHQHSGYTAVVVSLLYIGCSLAMISRLPTGPKPPKG